MSQLTIINNHIRITKDVLKTFVWPVMIIGSDYEDVPVIVSFDEDVIITSKEQYFQTVYGHVKFLGNSHKVIISNTGTDEATSYPGLIQNGYFTEHTVTEKVKVDDVIGFIKSFAAITLPSNITNDPYTKDVVVFLKSQLLRWIISILLAYAKVNDPEIVGRYINNVITFPTNLLSGNDIETSTYNTIKKVIANQLIYTQDFTTSYNVKSGAEWFNGTITLPRQIAVSKGLSGDEIEKFIKSFKYPTIGKIIGKYMDIYRDNPITKIAELSIGETIKGFVVPVYINGAKTLIIDKLAVINDNSILKKDQGWLLQNNFGLGINDEEKFTNYKTIITNCYTTSTTGRLLGINDDISSKIDPRTQQVIGSINGIRTATNCFSLAGTLNGVGLTDSFKCYMLNGSSWNDSDAISILGDVGTVWDNPAGNSTAWSFPFVSNYTYNTNDLKLSVFDIGIESPLTNAPSGSIFEINNSQCVPQNIPGISIDQNTGKIVFNKVPYNLNTSGDYKIAVSVSKDNINLGIINLNINVSCYLLQKHINNITWPFSLNNTKLEILENIVLTNKNQYFIIESDTITINGNNYFITLDTVGYNGFVKNGSSTTNGFSNIKINNTNIISYNSYITNESGWICQSYFGNNSVNNTLYMCYSNGTISGTNSGGIVGSNSKCNVDNCYTKGDITGNNSGGIFGANCQGNATNCYTTGFVSSGSFGSFGSYGMYGNGSLGTKTNCYSLHGSLGGVNETKINCYEPNGIWNTSNAKLKLQNINTSSIVSINSIWIGNDNLDIPFKLSNFNTFSYKTNSITINKATNSEIPSIPGSNFSIISINGNTSSSDLSITIDNSNGVLRWHYLKKYYNQKLYIGKKYDIVVLAEKYGYCNIAYYTINVDSSSSIFEDMDFNQSDVNRYTWPVYIRGKTFDSENIDNKKIELKENIIFTNLSNYFIFDNSEIVIEGNNNTITIDNISGYKGVFQNGVPKFGVNLRYGNKNTYSNIYINNIGVLSNNSSLDVGAGWLCQQNFGYREGSSIDQRSYIFNCYSNGNIDKELCGGLCGACSYVKISYSYSTGNISGVGSGGLVGGYSNSCYVENSFTSGNITGYLVKIDNSKYYYNPQTYKTSITIKGNSTETSWTMPENLPSNDNIAYKYSAGGLYFDESLLEKSNNQITTTTIRIKGTRAESVGMTGDMPMKAIYGVSYSAGGIYGTFCGGDCRSCISFGSGYEHKNYDAVVKIYDTDAYLLNNNNFFRIQYDQGGYGLFGGSSQGAAYDSVSYSLARELNYYVLSGNIGTVFHVDLVNTYELTGDVVSTGINGVNFNNTNAWFKNTSTSYSYLSSTFYSSIYQRNYTGSVQSTSYYTNELFNKFVYTEPNKLSDNDYNFVPQGKIYIGDTYSTNSLPPINKHFIYGSMKTTTSYKILSIDGIYQNIKTIYNFIDIDSSNGKLTFTNASLKSTDSYKSDYKIDVLIGSEYEKFIITKYVLTVEKGSEITKSTTLYQSSLSKFSWPVFISKGTVENPVVLTFGEDIIFDHGDIALKDINTIGYTDINNNYYGGFFILSEKSYHDPNPSTGNEVSNIIINGNNKKITIKNNIKFTGLFESEINNDYSTLTIKNLNISSIGSYISDNCGWLGTGQSYNFGNIINCSSDCSISGKKCGGLLGSDIKANITNCYTTGVISGENSGGIYAGNGSIAGSHSDVNIIDSYSTGNISGAGAGGIGGGYVTFGKVMKCYSTGNISGIGAGGILGEKSSIIVENCYTIGVISGKGSGGIFGSYGINDFPIPRPISISGEHINENFVVSDNQYDTTIYTYNCTNCYTKGIISGEGSGGIFGVNSKLISKNCYSSGLINNAYNNTLTDSDIKNGYVNFINNNKFLFTETELITAINEAISSFKTTYSNLKPSIFKNTDGTTYNGPNYLATFTEQLKSDFKYINKSYNDVDSLANYTIPNTRGDIYNDDEWALGKFNSQLLTFHSIIKTSNNAICKYICKIYDLVNYDWDTKLTGNITTIEQAKTILIGNFNSWFNLNLQQKYPDYPATNITNETQFITEINKAVSYYNTHYLKTLMGDVSIRNVVDIYDFMITYNYSSGIFPNFKISQIVDIYSQSILNTSDDYKKIRNVMYISGRVNALSTTNNIPTGRISNFYKALYTLITPVSINQMNASIKYSIIEYNINHSTNYSTEVNFSGFNFSDVSYPTIISTILNSSSDIFCQKFYQYINNTSVKILYRGGISFNTLQGATGLQGECFHISCVSDNGTFNKTNINNTLQGTDGTIWNFNLINNIDTLLLTTTLTINQSYIDSSIWPINISKNNTYIILNEDIIINDTSKYFTKTNNDINVIFNQNSKKISISNINHLSNYNENKGLFGKLNIQNTEEYTVLLDSNVMKTITWPLTISLQKTKIVLNDNIAPTNSSQYFIVNNQNISFVGNSNFSITFPNNHPLFIQDYPNTSYQKTNTFNYSPITLDQIFSNNDNNWPYVINNKLSVNLTENIYINNTNRYFIVKSNNVAFNNNNNSNYIFIITSNHPLFVQNYNNIQTDIINTLKYKINIDQDFINNCLPFTINNSIEINMMEQIRLTNNNQYFINNSNGLATIKGNNYTLVYNNDIHNYLGFFRNVDGTYNDITKINFNYLAPITQSIIDSHSEIILKIPLTFSITEDINIKTSNYLQIQSNNITINGNNKKINIIDINNYIDFIRTSPGYTSPSIINNLNYYVDINKNIVENNNIWPMTIKTPVIINISEDVILDNINRYISIQLNDIRISGNSKTITLKNINNYTGFIQKEDKYTNLIYNSNINYKVPLNQNIIDSYIWPVNIKLNYPIILEGDIKLTNSNQYFVFQTTNITLDGNNNKITIDSVSNYPGLFESKVNSNNNVVRKLNVVSSGNSSISEGGGWIYQKDSNGSVAFECSVNCPISSNAGGIFGKNCTNCNTAKCYNNGIITNSSGGIFGTNCTNCNAVLCYNTGSISDNSGGIFGNTGQNVNISMSYNTGSISNNSGGLITNNTNNCMILDSYNIGSCDNTSGGIIGKNNTKCTIVNVHSLYGKIISDNISTPFSCYEANGSWNNNVANEKLLLVGVVWNISSSSSSSYYTLINESFNNHIIIPTVINQFLVNNYSWPLYIAGGNKDNILNISFDGNINFTGTIIVKSDYISFEGNNKTITNTKPLIQNGTLNSSNISLNDGYSNITIQNINYVSTTAIVQDGFGLNKVNNKILNSSNTGNICGNYVSCNIATCTTKARIIGTNAVNCIVKKCYTNLNNSNIISNSAKSCYVIDCYISQSGIWSSIYGEYADSCYAYNCYNAASEISSGIFGNHAYNCIAKNCFSLGNIGSGGIYGTNTVSSKAINCYTTGIIGKFAGGIFGFYTKNSYAEYCYTSGMIYEYGNAQGANYDANGNIVSFFYMNPGGLFTTDSDGYVNKSAVYNPYYGSTQYFKNCYIGSNFKNNIIAGSQGDGFGYYQWKCKNVLANNISSNYTSVIPSTSDWDFTPIYPSLYDYSEFRTINKSSVINNSMLLSFLYSWPLSITGGTSSQPVIVTIGEDISLSDSKNYLNVKSNYITVDGNDKNISISKIASYKGFINNGTSGVLGYENVTVNNIKILSYNSSLDNNGGWICQSYFGNNTSQNNNILIKNCFSNGDISGNNAGGIIGNNSKATVSVCCSIGNITGSDSGGIFGSGCVGTISNCFSSGNISGNNSGGIYGSGCTGVISGCYSKGNISNNSGGICGYNYSGALSNCFSLGVNSGNGISFSSSSVIMSNYYIANGNWNYVEADKNILISSDVWAYDMNGYYKIKDFIKNINKSISSTDIGGYINIPNNYINMKNIENQNGFLYNSVEKKLDFSNVTNQNINNFITFDSSDTYPIYKIINFPGQTGGILYNITDNFIWNVPGFTQEQQNQGANLYRIKSLSYKIQGISNIKIYMSDVLRYDKNLDTGKINIGNENWINNIYTNAFSQFSKFKIVWTKSSDFYQIEFNFDMKIENTVTTSLLDFSLQVNITPTKFKKYIISNNSHKFQNFYFIKSDYDMINYNITKVFDNGITENKTIHLSESNKNVYNWPLVLSKDCTLILDSNIIMNNINQYFHIIGANVTINGNNKSVTISTVQNHSGLIYNSIYTNLNVLNLTIN